MALQSYSDLKTAITGWLQNVNLAAQAADFIALAEADFRRQLVTPDMDAVVTVTSDAPIPLPPDFDSLRGVTVAGGKTYALERVPLDEIANLPVSGDGCLRYYAIDGTGLTLHPAPLPEATVRILYRATVPALSDARPTNWLLVKHPDAYLFGSLLQAEFFGWNDERLPLIQTKLQAIIDDINAAGQRRRHGSGPLVMRLGRQPDRYTVSTAPGFLTDGPGGYLVEG